LQQEDSTPRLGSFAALLRAGRALTISLLIALAALLYGSDVSQGSLAGRFAAGQQRAGQLQHSIQADSKLIQGYEGRIGNLQARLNVIERSVTAQELLLGQVNEALGAAQWQLRSLEERYARGKRVLAAQLVADYESPQPTLVDVVMTAHGFNDLVNQLSAVRSIARANANTIRVINSTRTAVAAQTRQLAKIQVRRRRATAAVLVEQDEVAQLKLAIVGRELTVSRDRGRKSSQLSSLRRVLARQAAVLQRQAEAAQVASFVSGGAPAGGCVNTPFVAHGGEFGFFPAPGTNYTVNQEPIIAARLDALGQALQLHLIGVSGYRTPQHSVEVGGFADDPHTQGLASDTPGVEGVPEATLERFCLTRPFGGAREADHIQEL
jgi:peptidoglycan hydrolase CwlO-like protein